MDYVEAKKLVMKNTEWIRKNCVPLAIGFYVGLAATFLGISTYYERMIARKGPSLNSLLNPMSREKVSLDTLTEVFVATGTILTNRTDEKTLREIFLACDSRLYKEREVGWYLARAPLEESAIRRRQLIGLLANFCEMERKGSFAKWSRTHTGVYDH